MIRFRDRAARTDPETPCLICGTRVLSSRSRSTNVICVICRAAILDRVFNTRRQINRK